MIFFSPSERKVAETPNSKVAGGKMTEVSRRSSCVKEVLASLPKPQVTRMKIISMGDENTGKSCIIKRYCEERFIPKYITTIGVDYGVKRVVLEQNVDVRVNFWDFAGGNEYLEVRNEFYKDAQGAILVFDVTSMASFAHLETWWRESVKWGAKDLVGCLCANKVDLPKRVVSEVDGRKWASAKGWGYFEVSASTGQNVSTMLEQLFQDVYNLRKL